LELINMRLKSSLLMGAVLLARSLPAQAAPQIVAVADFDYVDSSGEPANQQAAHAQRLDALKAEIIASLTQSGHFTGVALNCAKPPCSAGNLDQDDISKWAHAQNAQFVVFGGVHKISTLIQWGQVEVMNTATGKAVASRTVTFRGDSDDAWRHAADYVGQLVVAAIK
jgi:TolB-like protein